MWKIVQYKPQKCPFLSQSYVERVKDDHLLQDQFFDQGAFDAQVNQYIMYYQKAIQDPDAAQFTEAVIKEVNSNINNKQWRLVTRIQVPKYQYILPSLWLMKRNRGTQAGKVYKHTLWKSILYYAFFFHMVNHLTADCSIHPEQLPHQTCVLHCVLI